MRLSYAASPAATLKALNRDLPGKLKPLALVIPRPVDSRFYKSRQGVESLHEQVAPTGTKSNNLKLVFASSCPVRDDILVETSRYESSPVGTAYL